MTTVARRGLDTLCWLLAAIIAGWALVRLLGWERGPLVPLIAFTVWSAAAAPLVAGAILASRRWWAAAMAGLAAVALLLTVAPRAIADPAPTGGVPLRVLTVNLRLGAADAAQLAELVRRHRVDVLALQEFTPGFATDLAATTVRGDLPFAQAGPVPGAEGSALYSRHPLSAGGVRSTGWFLQAYAVVRVPGAPPTYVESVHPCPPIEPADLSCWWDALAAQLPADPAGPPRVLAGDFNATLDHAGLRRLMATGYRDAADAAGVGLVGTWGPYDGDLFPPVVIDHVLVDERIGVRDARVLSLTGSDHRPVLAELRLPSAAPTGGQ